MLKRFLLPVLSCCLISAAHLLLASEVAALPVVPEVGAGLYWQHPPVSSAYKNGVLRIEAGPHTNWFAPPMGGSVDDNTPRLLFKPEADFVLSAKLKVPFRSTWDSGALVLYVNDQLWAKLCFEQTIEQHPAIVSVVTREWSDDNNSIAVAGEMVYLKVAKQGQAIFFYASQDGRKWSIIRAFTLGKNVDLRVGFSSQSPAGAGCTTEFSEIHYVAHKVNLWTGEPE